MRRKEVFMGLSCESALEAITKPAMNTLPDVIQNPASNLNAHFARSHRQQTDGYFRSPGNERVFSGNHEYRGAKGNRTSSAGWGGISSY